jgi:hypothetical protein
MVRQLGFDLLVVPSPESHESDCLNFRFLRQPTGAFCPEVTRHSFTPERALVDGPSFRYARRNEKSDIFADLGSLLGQTVTPVVTAPADKLPSSVVDRLSVRTVDCSVS